MMAGTMVKWNGKDGLVLGFERRNGMASVRFTNESLGEFGLYLPLSSLVVCDTFLRKALFAIAKSIY